MAGLSGLASGVDTSTLVDQLISIERQALTRVNRRQVAVQARQTGLREVASRLSSLASAAGALTASSTWAESQTVESSNSAKVGVARIGGAGTGGHTIQVTRLAASAQRGFAWTPSAAAGTLRLGAVDIAVAADAKAADVAAAINAKGDAPAFAAVIREQLTGEERIVLSSRTTGQASWFEVDATRLAAGQLAEKAAYERKGVTLDAEYKLDAEPEPRTSGSNVVENAVAGLRLTLKAVTTEAVGVSVSAPTLDRDGIKAKVRAFVDAYNAVLNTAKVRTTEKTVLQPSSDSEAGRGQLFGDSGVLSMLGQLRERVLGRVAGLTGIDELSDIGIGPPKASATTTSEARDGKLVIDDAKLTAALEADATKVRELFAGKGAGSPVTGFVSGIEAFVKAQTGGEGVFDARLRNADAEIKRIGTQMTRMDERLEAKEKRLKAQFAAMESALAASQSQQAWLTGQLDALNANRR
jgi:flagellar hook-associated protein 2